MHVLVLTFHRAWNYGALLQAWSLKTWLERQNIQCFFANLPELRQSHRLVDKIAASPLIWFSKHKLSAQKEVVISGNEVHWPDCDAYIVGSDQVWNPKITRTHSQLYFFKGLDAEKIISYAASFGESQWVIDPVETKYVASLLHRFSSISLREQSGLDLLWKHIGLRGELVLDPTLMNGDFSPLIFSTHPTKSYVAAYKFCQDASFFEFMKAVGREIKAVPKILNSILPHDGICGGGFLSPEKLVTHIGTSKFFITDSFHGVCCAILQRRNFAAFIANPNRKGRITSLLDQLGLENRIFESYKEAWDKKIWTQEIDYSAVYQRLVPLQQQSRDYLIKALKG